MTFYRHAITLILLALLLGCNSTGTENFALQVPSTIAIADDLAAQENLLRTLANAYPGKITNVALVNDDWTMLVNGARFYFAHGRFLPEALRGEWEKYLPYDFYPYPWTGTDKQRQSAYKNPVYSIGSSFLFDALYSSPTEDDSWELQVKYSFLGVKMLIHRDIKPTLDKVAAQVRQSAQSDPSINEWIAELQTGVGTYGWAWRPIVKTNRRSNHSYGTAVDLLPRDLKGMRTYWQWDKAKKKKQSPYYLPPAAVIKAFEDNGFIWGGKWDLIDTMHFEYRPEILLLNE